MTFLVILVHYFLGLIMFLLYGLRLCIQYKFLQLLSWLIQNLLSFFLYVIDLLKTAVIVLLLGLDILTLLFYRLILSEDVL